MGHQLSHFLLGFFVCFATIVGGYLGVRVLIDFATLRDVLGKTSIKLSVPFLANFMVQFVYAVDHLAFSRSHAFQN
jgi:Zn-dependent protease with chaperone function